MRARKCYRANTNDEKVIWKRQSEIKAIKGLLTVEITIEFKKEKMYQPIG